MKRSPRSMNAGSWKTQPRWMTPGSSAGRTAPHLRRGLRGPSPLRATPERWAPLSEVGTSREPGVVLGERSRGRLGAGEVFDPRELEPALERTTAEVVQKVGHVVREVLGLPDPAQCRGRVGVHSGGRAVYEPFGQP